MKNLAGKTDCDRDIAEELRRSMIPSVLYAGHLGEVPSLLRGVLGPFSFSRAWYYWVVDGPLPISIARELYEDPIGRSDIRVAGHCGCPAPEEPWIRWYTADGKQVLDLKQEAEFEGHRDGDSALMRRLCAENVHKYAWSDDPLAIGAAACVAGYHIDSEVGLRLFCDTVRKHGLDKAKRPSWWSGS